MDAYLALIADLPRPTAEQTAAFVGFVAGAHSWYKHLPPFPPGAPFVFFLDPDAGRDLVRLPGGERAFVDRTDEEQRFHYTWMLTTRYRERFGHWSYATDHAPRLFVGSPRAGWSDLSPRAVVLGREGDWLPLPADLARAGACRCTGLVHELLSPSMFTRRFPDEVDAFEARARACPEDVVVREHMPLLRRLRPEAFGPDGEGDLDALHARERARQRAAMHDAMRRALAAIDCAVR